MIPKRIFYAWFGNDVLPIKVKDRVQQWKNMLPDYEFVEINETNFDVKRYAFAQQAYEAGEWAFVSDVARLDFVYRFGGVYLDVDVEILKPLDDLLTATSFWGLENSDAINSGLIFGGHEGNRDIFNLLNLYQDLQFNPNEIFSSITVGIITRYFLQHGFKYKNKRQVVGVDSAVIYPTSYFAPIHYWGGGRANSRSVTIHHYSGTWIENQNWKKYNKFWASKEAILHFPQVYYLLKNVKRQLKTWGEK